MLQAAGSLPTLKPEEPHLYWIWATLEEHAEHFVERPFFHDWVIRETDRFSLYCPFDGVDQQRFPNGDDERATAAAIPADIREAPRESRGSLRRLTIAPETLRGASP